MLSSRRLAGPLLALAALTLPAAADAPAAATQPAGLSQPAGVAGCIATKEKGCARDAALAGVQGIAVTGDGRFVLAAARDASALVLLRRSTATGGLRRAACFSASGRAGCTTVKGLLGVSAVAVDPAEDRDVYAAAPRSGRLLHFRRSPSGALAYAGCVASTPAAGCAAVHPKLAEVDHVAVVDGGRAVVATASGGDILNRGAEDAAVLVLTRDAATGTLTPAGCLVPVRQPGCEGGDVLPGPTYGPPAVTAGGRVLVLPGAAQVTVARIGDGGGITLTGCLAEAARPGCQAVPHLQTGGLGPPDLALSPDGRHLLSAGFDGRLPVDPVAIMSRPLQADGTVGALRCIAVAPGTETRGRARECAPGRPTLDGPDRLLVSPDGRRVATLDFTYSRVGLLVRSPATGALGRVGGRAGCIAPPVPDLGEQPPDPCASGRRLNFGNLAAFTPDGRWLYVASVNGVATLRVR